MPTFGARPSQGPPFIFSFIWLVYMLFPVYYVLQRPLVEQLIDFPLLFAFSCSYIYAYHRREGRLLAIFALIAIVFFFAWRYDFNFLYLAFYPAPMIGYLTDIKKTAAAGLALLALFLSVLWHYDLFVHTDHLLQILPALLVMLILPAAMRISRRSADLKNKLAFANEEIARMSKNEERQRISRDLHDTLGHTLSLITLKSELAEKLIAKNPERAAQEVRDIQLTSRAALKQVRELVSGMNTSSVADELVQAKQILTAAGIELRLSGEPGQDGHAPAPLVDNMLGMCLREAVTNVVKHSKARVCTIEWADTSEGFELSVTDDGQGADPAACTGDVSKNGLTGIRERLKLVEGRLDVDTAEGCGTRIVFHVPKVTKSRNAEEGNR